MDGELDDIDQLELDLLEVSGNFALAATIGALARNMMTPIDYPGEALYTTIQDIVRRMGPTDE
ncbi:hypothetical protein SEA_SHROOMBOI_39 [Mycobacterium phage ShroomBoi]|nr:hypothetical protein SEA_SHROOMBOI_39 [Mycobacterium phage ShroomBoi]